LARDDLAGQVSAGGGYDNFEFVITDAWFGPSEAFTAKTKINAIFLHWVGTTTLDGVPTLDAEDFHPSYMIGDDFDIADEGKAIRWIGNPATPVDSQMIKKWYGRLLDELKEDEELIALPDGQHPLDGPKGMQLQAATWIGTKWFMQNKFYEFSKGSPNMSDATHLMPVRFLGRVTGETAATSAPVSTTTEGTPAENNGDQREQVTNLAGLIDDYATWQKAALNVDGVSTDIPLVQEIADQTENGLYARARA